MSDEILTGNGRAVVQRDDLGGLASESIDLPPVSELDKLIIAFITRRNTILPPVARLDANGVLEFAFGARLTSQGGRGGDFRGRIRIHVDYF